MSRGGRPVLRVNAAGVLAKVGAPSLDAAVARVLKVDQEARSLYLTAVATRVTGMPWDDAANLVDSDARLPEPDHVALFGGELRNEYDFHDHPTQLAPLVRSSDHASSQADRRQGRIAGVPP
jgi:hypothetical protein